MESFKNKLLQEEIDEELSDLMVRFLIDLDYDMLSVEKQSMYFEILDLLDADENLEDTDPEDISEKLKRHINKADKAKRKAEYRKNKGKLKRAGKKLRKTAAFKKKKKKSKRMAKRGKTASGKRQTTFT